MTGILRSIWAMACWCTLAIPWRMKMMPQRAVRAGLEIVEALMQLALQYAPYHILSRCALAFTPGLVVVGEMGGGEQAGTAGVGRDAQHCRARAGAWPSPIPWSSARPPIAWSQGLFECEDRGRPDTQGHLHSADRCIGWSEKGKRRAALRWRSQRA